MISDTFTKFTTMKQLITLILILWSTLSYSQTYPFATYPYTGSHIEIDSGVMYSSNSISYSTVSVDTPTNQTAYVITIHFPSQVGPAMSLIATRYPTVCSWCYSNIFLQLTMHMPPLANWYSNTPSYSIGPFNGNGIFNVAPSNGNPLPPYQPYNLTGEFSSFLVRSTIPYDTIFVRGYMSNSPITTYTQY